MPPELLKESDAEFCCAVWGKDRSVKDRSSLAVESGGTCGRIQQNQEMITKNDRMTLPFRKK
jgi:hypothetical protein